MLTKYAFFIGTLKAGLEEAMKHYVEQTLQPLWQQFQPSVEVRVLYNVEQDKNGPPIPLVLAVTYVDEEAMAQAMETDARYQARDLLPGFYEKFFNDVKLRHYVLSTAGLSEES